MTRLTCPTLAIPCSVSEQVILAGSADAVRLCRDGGYQELPSHQGSAYLDRLATKDLTAARAFLAQSRLLRWDLDRLDDHQVLALLGAHVRCRELVALRECAGAVRGDESSLATQRRLVRQIESLSRQRLSHAGRSYRLVPDGELGRLPDRDRYEVVRREEAVRVLDGLAGQAGSGAGSLGELLAQAREKLTRDWRPPLVPDGLILLRRIVVSAPQAHDLESPITPSQMKQMMKGWVEVIVVWDDTGRPVAGLPLTAESSGNSQSLTTDGSGRIRVDDLEDACEVSCRLDDVTLDRCVAAVGFGTQAAEVPGGQSGARAASGDGSPAPQAIAVIEEHKVATGDTLESIAAKAGLTPQKLAKFNWGSDAPADLNQHLHDDVGCTKKTADGRDYLFDDIDTPGIVYLPSEWRQRLAPKQTYSVRVRRPKGILLTLENEEGLRLPEVGYHVAFDDGSERAGSLGRNGMALVPAPSTGTFQATYPDEVDIMAKSLAASLRKGFDDHRTGQIFRLFTHDRPVVAGAVAAYDRYFNDYTGKGFVEDLYQELTEPEALAVCEVLMALHGLPTRSGIRAANPSGEE